MTVRDVLLLRSSVDHSHYILKIRQHNCGLVFSCGEKMLTAVSRDKSHMLLTVPGRTILLVYCGTQIVVCKRANNGHDNVVYDCAWQIIRENSIGICIFFL